MYVLHRDQILYVRLVVNFFFGGGAMFCTKQHPMYELYLIIIYFVNDESSLQVIVYKHIR